MNLPIALLTIKWMIRDTLRQSLASRLFWVLLGITFICTIFCFSIRVEGDDLLPIGPSDIPQGLPANDPTVKKLGVDVVKKEGVDVYGSKISIGFGLISIHEGRDRKDAVRFLQIWLAGIVADTAGIFLVLIWTAGFLPGFLDPNHLTVLLAKPLPRWSLIFGKYLGVLVFVLIQASFFVLGTWLALGLKTGVYDGRYLLSLPVLLIHFGTFFSFSVLLAVWSRSTVVCVFGSLIFWVMCWGLNFGRHVALTQFADQLPASSYFILNTSYWLMPKPADMNLILFDLLKATGFSAGVKEFQVLKEQDRFHPELAVLSSLLFSSVMLLISARELHKMDY